MLWRWARSIGANVWIAAFTGLLLLSSTAQWWAIRESSRQNNAIIQQMRLEQRAWLGILATTIEEPIANTPIKAHIPFRNTGRTPGTITSISLGVTVIDKESGRSVDTNDTLEDRVMGLHEVVRGGVTALLYAEEWRQPVPPDGTIIYDKPIRGVGTSGFTALEQGTGVLFVYGAFIYLDVTGKERFTSFCLEYNPATGRGDMYHGYNDMQ